MTRLAIPAGFIGRRKPAQLALRSLHDPASSRLLLMLLASDLAFIALHVLHLTTTRAGDPRFLVSRDRGYGEVFQYLKFFWIALLLSWVGFRNGSARYLAWTAVFVYLLFDDAKKIHEGFGGYLVATFSMNPGIGLRAQDFGEFAASALIGLFLLALIVVACLRAPQAFKRMTADLLCLIGGIAAFGVGADMLHSGVRHVHSLNALLGLVEDGGEMIMVSVVAWYAFLLSQRAGDLPVWLHSLVLPPSRPRP